MIFLSLVSIPFHHKHTMSFRSSSGLTLGYDATRGAIKIIIIFYSNCPDWTRTSDFYINGIVFYQLNYRALIAYHKRTLMVNSMLAFYLIVFMLQADNENRTRIYSLEGCCSTIELCPHIRIARFELATSHFQGERPTKLAYILL